MPKDTPGDGTHLERYARLLRCAEINSSFYRPHARTTYERWAASTPADFFAVKMPRDITHDPRRGPLLIQLPPSFAYAARTAGRFLSLLRARYEGAVVVEPRHPSWFSAAADALLTSHGAGRVGADPPIVKAEARRPGAWTCSTSGCTGARACTGRRIRRPHLRTWPGNCNWPRTRAPRCGASSTTPPAERRFRMPGACPRSATLESCGIEHQQRKACRRTDAGRRRRNNLCSCAHVLNFNERPLLNARRDVPPGLHPAAAAGLPAATAQPTATAILSALTDVVITTDRAGRVSYMNPAAERVSGWAPTDVLGGSLAQLLRRDPRRSRRVDDGSADADPQIYQLVCRSGTARAIEVCEAMLADDRGVPSGRVFVCRDVGAALALSQAMHHGALHDALTGLTNRRGLLERLQDGLATAERLSTPLAVCFLDVDGLKAVNDVEGHGGGDQLLRSIAHRLSASVRASDTVARIGGDEFVVVLHRLEHARDAAVVTKSLTRRLARPHRIGGKLIAATASLGWGFYPDDGRDAQSLLATADRAMYVAKRARAACATADAEAPRGRSVDLCAFSSPGAD